VVAPGKAVGNSGGASLLGVQHRFTVLLPLLLPLALAKPLLRVLLKEPTAPMNWFDMLAFLELFGTEDLDCVMLSSSMG